MDTTKTQSFGLENGLEDVSNVTREATRKKIAADVENFLLKKGAKIQHIEYGLRGDPLVRDKKRTKDEIKKIWNRPF